MVQIGVEPVAILIPWRTSTPTMRMIAGELPLAIADTDNTLAVPPTHNEIKERGVHRSAG